MAIWQAISLSFCQSFFCVLLLIPRFGQVGLIELHFQGRCCTSDLEGRTTIFGFPPEFLVRSDPSRQDILNDVAVIDFQSLTAGDCQALRVEAEQVQHGCMDIGHVVRVLDRMKSELVG
jgi:hypothetical protein